MVNRMQFYIDGAWVDPVVKKSTPVVNPATEEAMYEIALGSKADVDKAVKAAKRAFDTFSQTSREERVALLSKVIEIYKSRMKEIGASVSDEMGAPLPMAEKLQAGAGLGHIMATLDVLKPARGLGEMVAGGTRSAAEILRGNWLRPAACVTQARAPGG